MGFFVFVGVSAVVYVLLAVIVLVLRLAGFKVGRRDEPYDDGYL
jgi:hypothetical protein